MLNKIVIQTAILTATILFSGTQPNLVFAQGTPTPSPTTTVSPSPTQTPSPEQTPSATNAQEVSGEILRKDGNTIFIETDDGIREVTINNNIAVSKNALPADVGDINPGDRANLMITDTGQVLSIDVTSGEIVDWAKVGIPALIGLLILGGLIYYLYRKSNKEQIMTSTESK